jgi:hypothetical protein
VFSISLSYKLIPVILQPDINKNKLLVKLVIKTSYKNLHTACQTDKTCVKAIASLTPSHIDVWTDGIVRNVTTVSTPTNGDSCQVILVEITTEIK